MDQYRTQSFVQVSGRLFPSISPPLAFVFISLASPQFAAPPPRPILPWRPAPVPTARPRIPRKDTFTQTSPRLALYPNFRPTPAFPRIPVDPLVAPLPLPSGIPAALSRPFSRFSFPSYFLADLSLCLVGFFSKKNSLVIFFKRRPESMISFDETHCRSLKKKTKSQNLA